MGPYRIHKSCGVYDSGLLPVLVEDRKRTLNGNWGHVGLQVEVSPKEGPKDLRDI